MKMYQKGFYKVSLGFLALSAGLLAKAENYSQGSK
jgi:hypothetical protein